MKKSRKIVYIVLVTVVTSLFIIATVLIKKYYNTTDNMFPIILSNSVIGCMTAGGIILIIDYPKTKDFAVSIFAALLACVAFVFLGLGLAVNQTSNYYLLISVVLICVANVVSVINLRKPRGNRQ